MNKIYRPDTRHVTVLEAANAIREARRWADPKDIVHAVYMGEDGLLDVDNIPEDFHCLYVKEDFKRDCEHLQIKPFDKYRPSLAADYFTGPADASMYAIRFADFIRLADLYGLEVAIGEAPAQAAPEQDEAPSVPAPPVAHGLGGLPTAEIAFSFDGIKYTESEWRKPLGEKLKWLEGAIYERRPPPKSNLWKPVEFAAAVHRQYNIAPKRLLARFQTRQALKPWLQAWIDYADEYIDTPP